MQQRGRCFDDCAPRTQAGRKTSAAAAAVVVALANRRFATAKDEAAQEMLLCLVERLGHEQEVGWLDSIAQELVGCCDALLDNPGVSGWCIYHQSHVKHLSFGFVIS
jgi:hypothetical protein